MKQFSFLGKKFFLLFIQIEIYTYFNIIRFYAWNNKFYILRQIENYESSQLFVRLHISSERRIKTPLDVIVVNKIFVLYISGTYIYRSNCSSKAHFHSEWNHKFMCFWNDFDCAEETREFHTAGWTGKRVSGQVLYWKPLEIFHLIKIKNKQMWEASCCNLIDFGTSLQASIYICPVNDRKISNVKFHFNRYITHRCLRSL